MNTVVAFDVGEATQPRAQALATALGNTLYEASNRLRVPGGGPLVLAVLNDMAAAIQMVTRLRAAGFDAEVVTEDGVETDAVRFVARRVDLEPEALRVEPRAGQPLELPWTSIDVVLFGSSASVHTDVTTIKGRKLDMGRALLTGGLMMTKGTKREVTRETQERERFLYLYSLGRPTVALREGELVYGSSGVALEASRTANFTSLATEMERRCKHARFDNSLLNRGRQALMLGAQLAPETHLDLAAALLSRAARRA